MMRLRYFQTYNQNGVNSENSLQYWDDEEKVWKDVNYIRVADKFENQYMCDKEEY